MNMPKATQPQSGELASNLGLLSEEVCTHGHDGILSDMTTVTGVMAAANNSHTHPMGWGDLP